MDERFRLDAEIDHHRAKSDRQQAEIAQARLETTQLEQRWYRLERRPQQHWQSYSDYGMRSLAVVEM